MLALALATTVFLAGCASTPSATPTPSAPPAAPTVTGPVKGGTLTIAVNSQVVSTDPHQQSDWNTMSSLWNIFDHLIGIDNDNNLVPMLAESWSASADGKTFTFKIRSGATYHDGTPITAESLVKNMDRIMDESLAAPARSTFLNMEQIVAEGDNLIVHWKSSFVPGQWFNDRLIHPFAVSPDVAIAQGKDFALKPIGSGPFIFESYATDDRVVAVRNDNYWAGAPYLDRVVARIIPDANTRRIEMEAGTIDVMLDVNPKDVAALQKRGIRIVRGPAASMQSLAVNLAKAPTNELAVRQAVAYAVNKPALIDKLLFGFATISTTGTHPASWGVNKDVKGYDYDVAAAKKALEDAGWRVGTDGVRVKDGQRLSLTFLARNDEQWLLIAQAVQENLSQVGFEVTLDTKDWGAFLDAMRAGQYDIAYWSLGGASFEPQGYTWNLLSTAHWNVSQINKTDATKALSEQVDGLLKAGEAEVGDQAKRGEIYKEFQKLVVDNVLLVPLWHNDRVTAVQPWVEDLVTPTLVSPVRAEKAWINPDKKK